MSDFDETQPHGPNILPIRDSVVSETFTVSAKPTPAEIVQTMARLAQFCNQLVGECLRSKVLSAANPASAALMNASAAIEQGSLQLQSLIQQQAGFAGGAQNAAAGRGPGPFRAN